jgi:acyl-CoA synthetase (AMP-forming)/AMP-acid ligase II
MRTANTVAEGEPGEVWAKGPQIMLGYWQKENESSEAMVDGWLKTGDIAQMDAEGYFTIVDRKKDMILVSGFNVYPNEVEEQIAAVPGVLEVGVIGVPDDKSGEQVRAYVVATHPAPSQEQIIAHCKQHMAAYKAPRVSFSLMSCRRALSGKFSAESFAIARWLPPPGRTLSDDRVIWGFRRSCERSYCRQRI